MSALQAELGGVTLELERLRREVGRLKEQERVRGGSPALTPSLQRVQCILRFSGSDSFPLRIFTDFPPPISPYAQATVGALTEELQDLRSQLADAGDAHARELSRLQESCADLQTHAEAALKEVSGKGGASLDTRCMTWN